MAAGPILWILFSISVVGMLVLDLFVVHRKAHAVGLKEAIFWSVVWTVVALLFNVLIYYWLGRRTALEFFTAYILERSLSVDNLFVFLLIFSYFGVAAKHQHAVLFWGIIGALVMRAVFIAAGVAVLHYFHFVFYLFGLFLIFTGIKMAFARGNEEIHPEKNILLRLARKLFPVTQEHEGSKFFVRKERVLHATPLFIVLLVVESSDVVFAVDSIPAVLGVSTDPFVVYTSNIFAILGLRALYFAIAGVMELFHYLHYGLSAVLVFIGVKMIVQDIYPISVPAALTVITAILIVAVVASLVRKKRREPEQH